MQLNLGNFTFGKNVVLSGNNVFGTNTAVGSPNSQQIVTGGIISGGAIFAF